MRAKLFLGAAALVLTGVPGAASAQDADAPGDASTQVSLNGSVDGEVAPAGDRDWYRLQVERGQRYQLNLDAVTNEDGAGLDPELVIYDRDGGQIAVNDDSGSLNSALTYTPSRDGLVYVEARALMDGSSGRYKLRVQASVAPADDAGNDASTRGRIAPGREISGAIEYEGDVDWYRLSTRTGQHYTIALNGGQEAGRLVDPLLRLIDRDGNELASNDDSGGGLNSALDYIPAQAGDVFIEASGLGGQQTGAYTLNVRSEALPTDDAAPAANTRARIALGQSIVSELSFPSDSDWHRVRLTEAQTYRFTLSGSGDSPLGDPMLRIRDSGGAEIAMDDDGGAGLNSYLEFTAPSTGNYFVEARDFSDQGIGGYTLSAAAGDIPGDASTDAGLDAEGDGRQGMLSPGGDRDWFSVDLQEGQAMRVSLNSAETEDALGDPMVVIHGPDGAALTNDDDGGEGLNAWLEFQAPAAGRYYVEARGFVDDAQGRYTLSLIAGEVGDNADNAEYLSPNSEGRTSLIGTSGDVDWFAVELIEGRPYRFNAAGLDPGALADPMLVLYDGEGREVARDDDGGSGLNAYLTFMSATGGVYYAAVSAVGETEGTGRYALRVSDTDVPGANNTDEFLDAGSDERLSRIDLPGDLDGYRVELEAGAAYVIEVSGAGEHPLADPFVAVLDSNGASVASDDDSGDGLDARVRFAPAQSGPYLIQASGLGGSTGWYQVKIERR